MEDLEKPNPSVYLDQDIGGEEKVAETLEEFFIAAARVQACGSLEFRAFEFECVSETDKKMIRDYFKREKSITPTGYGIGDIYGYNDNTVVGIFEHECQNNIYYASNNEDDFIEIEHVLCDLGIIEPW